MADVKVSALPAAGALSSADTLSVVQGGTSKKATLDQLPVSTPVQAAIAAMVANDMSPSTTVAPAKTAVINAIAAAVAGLVASSPTTLDTLNELATALGNDPNFATTIATAIGGKQPLDATLTAIAALTIAANSITLGTGADAFTQLVLGANTFLARSSTGNVAAKTITDFALSLLVAVDATAAMTTLGAAADLPGFTLPSGTTAITHAAHANRIGVVNQGGATIGTFAATATSGALIKDSFYLRNIGAGTFTASGAITAPTGYKLTALPGEAFTADYNSVLDAWISTTPALAGSAEFNEAIEDRLGATTLVLPSGAYDDAANSIRLPYVFAISVSPDEATALTNGTNKVSWHMPFAFSLVGISAGVSVAPTGADLIVDVNEAGATLMTTSKVKIDATKLSTHASATPPVLTDTSLAKGALMSIDVDQIGSTVAGAGLKVYLVGFITAF